MGFVFLWREAPLAPPLGELLSEREAEGVRLDKWGCYEPTHDTLSVSPFGLPAPLPGEARALRAGTGAFNRVLAKIRGYGRMRSAPTVGMCKYF